MLRASIQLAIGVDLAESSFHKKPSDFILHPNTSNLVFEQRKISPWFVTVCFCFVILQVLRASIRADGHLANRVNACSHQNLCTLSDFKWEFWPRMYLFPLKCQWRLLLYRKWPLLMIATRNSTSKMPTPAQASSSYLNHALVITILIGFFHTKNRLTITFSLDLSQTSKSLAKVGWQMLTSISSFRTHFTQLKRKGTTWLKALKGIKQVGQALQTFSNSRSRTTMPTVVAGLSLVA